MNMTKPAILIAMLMPVSSLAIAQDVNVYTYRETALIKPLFDAFTKETGIRVNAVFAKEGLEERIAAEGARSPADMLITVDVARLENAIDLGFVRPFKNPGIKTTVPASLRHPEDLWYGLSYRARVAYVSKERVKETALTYESLADPKWKGRFCSRDGQHVYNNMLFAAGIAHLGEARAETWLKGLKANLAQKPSGGDRDVAKNIAAGVCDIGFGNTYYIGLMLNKSPEQRPWAEAVRVILPKFEGSGTHVNLSGFALLKAGPNATNADTLAAWLLGPTAQAMYTNDNFEYAVRSGGTDDPVIAAFGKLEPDSMPFSAIVKARKTAADLVDRVGFNAGAN